MISTFDHERLHVYRIALDFVTTSEEILQCCPAGRSYLSDQLHRATSSLVLNIAEGAGEFSKKEKARFYRMAARSATECAASIDMLIRVGVAESESMRLGRQQLLRIVSMLVLLIKNLTGYQKIKGRSGSSSGTGTGTGLGTGIGAGTVSQQGLEP